MRLAFRVFSGRGIDHLFTAIKTVRRDAMTRMCFAGRGLYRQSGLGNVIVRAMHSAFAWGFSAFLHWHDRFSLKRFIDLS